MPPRPENPRAYSGGVDAPVAAEAAVKIPPDSTHYTHIHGAWYDLTNFSHPGGPVALSLAYGRDATVLFEQSHVFTDRARLAALLAPLRAPPALCAALHARFPRAAAEASCFDFDAAAQNAGAPPEPLPRVSGPSSIAEFARAWLTLHAQPFFSGIAVERLDAELRSAVARTASDVGAAVASVSLLLGLLRAGGNAGDFVAPLLASSIGALARGMVLAREP